MPSLSRKVKVNSQILNAPDFSHEEARRLNLFDVKHGGPLAVEISLNNPNLMAGHHYIYNANSSIFFIEPQINPPWLRL